MVEINITQVAESIPFDKDGTTFASENVQDALEELSTDIDNSASPGFTWGRSGNTSAGTWLLNEGVPSNKSGRTIMLTSPDVVRLYSSSEDTDTYIIELYHHEGNSVNLTLITSLSVTASRTGNSGSISVTIPGGKQLAIKLSSGSAKNIVTGVVLKGSLS